MDTRYCEWYMFNYVLNGAGRMPLDKLWDLNDPDDIVIKRIETELQDHNIQCEYASVIMGTPTREWAVHIVSDLIKIREVNTLPHVPQKRSMPLPDSSFIALALDLAARGEISSVWVDWQNLVERYTSNTGAPGDDSGAVEIMRRLAIVSKYAHKSVSLQGTLDWALGLVVATFKSFDRVMQLCADLPQRLKNLLGDSKVISMSAWLGLYDRQMQALPPTATP